MNCEMEAPTPLNTILPIDSWEMIEINRVNSEPEIETSLSYTNWKRRYRCLILGIIILIIVIIILAVFHDDPTPNELLQVSLLDNHIC